MLRPAIFWRYFSPVLLVIFTLIVAGFWLIPDYAKSMAIKNATEQGRLTAERLKELRGYYTRNVINKVLANTDLQVSFDHKDNSKVVPLPATMIHDLSDIYSQDELSIKLYSSYPFPIRSTRKLDDFELRAWHQLTQDKTQVLSFVEQQADQVFVRTAIADTMTSQTCLDCHNSRADSPKTDWKLGDIRGVLEVRQNISSAIETGTEISYQIALILTFLMLVMAMIIFTVAKKIQAQLLETRTLNEQLIENNDQLAIVNEQLVNTNQHLVKSERMSLLGSLVAGTSHELNTPIGICVTAMSSLRDKLNELKDKVTAGELTKKTLTNFIDNASEASQITFQNLERAAELIKSFKVVAVEETTNQEHAIDFHAFLKDVILSLKPQYKKGGHQVCVVSEGDWKLLTFPGSWAQIITNLITNSVLHGFQERSQGRIEISAQLTEQLMIFTYSDNGVGMSEEVFNQLFTPFYTTKKDQGGTGLGMHLVQDIVHLKLNGEITCKSIPGEGTTFIIQVPVVDTAKDE